MTALPAHGVERL